MTEWRDVVGFEGLYQVSDEGDVRNTKTGLLRKPQVNPRDGRPNLMLYRGRKGTYKQISHIVLEAYVSPRPGKLLGLHWDDNSFNNRPANLRWGTHSDNQYDKVRNGNHHNANKTHCIHEHEFTESNTKIVHWKGRVLRQCRACHLDQQRASSKNQVSRQVEKGSDPNRVL